jgi:hypothetical protein
MAPSSVRDIIVHGDDLIAGTHGRGFWILDDITPLRQLTTEVSRSDAFLYKPQTATRVRWNMNTDTPLPPDEPASKNPPDGAILNYYLAKDAQAVTLEILDAAGSTIRTYAHTDPVERIGPDYPVPTYWVRPLRALPATAGMHRVTWDMRYQPLSGAGGRGGLPIAAIAQDTAPIPNSIWASPGQYRVRLTVDGKTFTQPLTLRMDPRVKTAALGIQQQFTLSKALYDDIRSAQSAIQQIRAARGQGNAAAFAQRLTELEGATPGGRGGGRDPAPAGPDSLTSVSAALNALMTSLQAADVTPTTQVVAAITDRRAALAKLMAKWKFLRSELGPEPRP